MNSILNNSNIQALMGLMHFVLTWNIWAMSFMGYTPCNLTSSNRVFYVMRFDFTLKPFTCGIFQREHRHIFIFHVISSQWSDTGSWNSSSSKTGTYLFHTVSIMAAVAVFNRSKWFEFDYLVIKFNIYCLHLLKYQPICETTWYKEAS